MKWKTTLGMALAGVMLTAPAWTHHAAQGIVSDDVWLRIDDQVSDMHQEILEDVMGSMRVVESTDSGSMFLVTFLKTTVAECPALEDLIRDVLRDETEDWVHDPSGDTDPNENAEDEYNNNYTPVLYENESGEACICEGDLDDDICVIELWEPIGSVGWHEDDEDPADEIYEGDTGPHQNEAKKGK